MLQIHAMQWRWAAAGGFWQHGLNKRHAYQQGLMVLVNTRLDGGIRRGRRWNRPEWGAVGIQ